MTALAEGRAALDIQALQSVDHRDRGVARYVLEMARALEAGHGDSIGQYLINPDLGPPGHIEPLLATGKVTASDRAELPEGGVLHIASPFELSVGLDRLWPAEAKSRRLRLVVTVYDLIPEIFGDFYLEDPGLRRRYQARQQLVRAADHVLAISQSTANDTIERWHIDPAKVTVINAGVSPWFQPPTSRADALSAARAAVPGLEARFVLFNGGMDDRKNIDGLLVAYSRLPLSVRTEHQLVIVCEIGPSQRNHYDHRTRQLGIDGRVLFTGYVPDETLVLLEQSTELFVFPSLYEGFGLPVAEAMACGAPTIGSSTSSVGELVHGAAAFDPSHPDAIADAMLRGLTDDDLRTYLFRQSARAVPTWAEVADRTVEVYDRVLARRPPAWRKRPLVAFATPLPPARTDVGRYSTLLIDELTRQDDVDVDVFVDGLSDTAGPPQAPAGHPVHPVARLTGIEHCRGGYDAVVYAMGNSEFHIGALAALRRRTGTVLAHDVRLTGLYALGVGYPDAVPDGFHQCLQRMYAPLIPPDLGVSGRVDAADADRYGIAMAREVIALSERFLTTSAFAASLAEMDARPEHVDRIGVVPFAMRPPDAGLPERSPASAEPVVASFGVVNAVKRTALIIEAFALLAPARPRARLAVVGPASDSDLASLVELVDTLGVADQVTLTNEVSDEDYAAWMARATVALQLRASTNGEMSSAVGNCLASRVPTIVTAIGAARELPDDAVVKVPVDVSAAELAAAIADLLDDGSRRVALAAGALRCAAEHTFAQAAIDLSRFLARSGAFQAGVAPKND